MGPEPISRILLSSLFRGSCASGNCKRNHVKFTRESLRHLRHALPIQPHFANAFNASEDIVHGLTAETHQFGADDTGDASARENENLMCGRTWKACADNRGHR